jgi:hypothetical protein
VLQVAYLLAGRLVEANAHTANSYPSLFMIFRAALKADEVTVDEWQKDEKVQAEFGRDLVMMMIGSGISWFDSHNEFPLRWPDVEWSYLHLEDLGVCGWPVANGKWQLLWKSHQHGHWFLSPDGRLTRADHSGDSAFNLPTTPVHCDDGPIYVDMTKPAERRNQAVGTCYNFHAFRKTGERCYFLAENDAAQWVFKKFPFLRPRELPLHQGAES